MKQLLITIAVVLLVGCGKTQKSDTKIENQLVKTVTKSSQSKLNTSKVLSCCNSIHEAAANGKIDAVKAYLNAGADVNERDSDGLTPLHLVEKKEIAELLIAKGAELNPIDNFFEYTPLDFMEGEVEQDTINFLRKHGGKTAAELKSSVSTDDLETYTLSEPEGTISTLVISPDGSFRESLGFRGEAKRPENTLIGSWKIEGELLVLEGTTELDSKQTIIKFNKTTGKIVSINSNGDEVPTEELDRLTIKKN